MNILSGIIGGVKAIFGAGESGSDNVLKAATGIGKWIDNKEFTEQEKAEYNKSLIQPFQEFMTNTVTENSERSRTRRDLSIWIIRTWIFMLISSILLFRLDKEWSEYIFNVASHDNMGWLVLGIGGFFWGSHLVRQFPAKSKSDHD